MSNGLKALGIIGAGAALALGLAASDSNTALVSTPAAVVVPSVVETKPVPEPITPDAPKPASNCHPSYSGCLKMNAGDYDCASGSGNGPNYTGAVQVYSSDPFDLDRDNDGWGCER